ncbi:hypothetical protein VTN02DRAFT_5588 [Thermoascus thermophilus]
MSVQQPPKVIFFDVFGTSVDWRSSVIKALIEHTDRALRDPGKNLSTQMREAASALTPEDWRAFADEWRRSYYHFTRNFDPSKGFISVDQHHYESLQKLLQKWHIEGLFTDDETRELSLCWHRLNPWPDTIEGLTRLNTKFETCTLSNGNVSLLEDLLRHGPLPFAHVASSEQFGACKPSPLVYNRAAARFGLEPKDCALVAAHLDDVKAAKGCGFQTVYVERADEESLTEEQITEAKQGGWVDMWVDLNTGGFLEIARRFGI